MNRESKLIGWVVLSFSFSNRQVTVDVSTFHKHIQSKSRQTSHWINSLDAFWIKHRKPTAQLHYGWIKSADDSFDDDSMSLVSDLSFSQNFRNDSIYTFDVFLSLFCLLSIQRADVEKKKNELRIAQGALGFFLAPG